MISQEYYNKMQFPSFEHIILLAASIFPEYSIILLPVLFFSLSWQYFIFWVILFLIRKLVETYFTAWKKASSWEFKIRWFPQYSPNIIQKIQRLVADLWRYSYFLFVTLIAGSLTGYSVPTKIFVYFTDVPRPGRNWSDHVRIKSSEFFQILQTSYFIRRTITDVVFENDVDIELWILDVLRRDLPNCLIKFDTIALDFVLGWLGNEKLIASRHFYSPGMIGIGFPLAKVESLRIDEADDAILQDIENMTGLKSLHMRLPTGFRVAKKLELSNLKLGTATEEVISGIFENIEVSKLESLSLERMPNNWLAISTGLRRIKELEINGSIRFIPSKKIKELHYAGDVPLADWEFIVRHPVRTLGCNPTDGRQHEILENIHWIGKMWNLKTLHIGEHTLSLENDEWVPQVVVNPTQE
ncbi:uncharacterized protein J8A68_005270 [[Candida] subhashii]|uniref:Uncharacterized protein n=1 Tax=[Candida] subhashii TaxID=561895 RepID=A0A8J5UJK2_9ASCO|nr:uncharacterized protein J8A68_005270 [[Candida] subhashii]KAG7661216.1 hypothetical protein J8A68_005270 [[Candida] subhashii]